MGNQIHSPRLIGIWHVAKSLHKVGRPTSLHVLTTGYHVRMIEVSKPLPTCLSTQLLSHGSPRNRSYLQVAKCLSSKHRFYRDTPPYLPLRYSSLDLLSPSVLDSPSTASHRLSAGMCKLLFFWFHAGPFSLKY